MKMIRTFLLCLSVVCVWACTTGNKIPNDAMVVMSFNIRYDNPDDGENIWDNRKPAIKELLHDLQPDVFGVQEAEAHQVRYIESECPEYASIGVGRDDGKEAGEFMSIFYLRDELKVNDWGTIWLSETPQKPSLGWDAWCKRTATWAAMEYIDSGQKFFYVNTHLDHGGRNARKNGLDLIIGLIKEKNIESCPAVITGDFNVPPDDTLTLGGLYSYMYNAAVTAEVTDDYPTTNGFGKRTPKHIDYIWWKGFRSCSEYRVNRKEYSGVRYISDHWPIIAEFAW